MMKTTISIEKGRGSMRHNNRDFYADNVDRTRSKNNITYKKESLEHAYEKLFGDAVRKYNKGKKPSRQIHSYIEHIRESKNGEKLFYEIVVQVGNMHTCPVGSEQGKIASEILDKFMKDFEKRNSNLYVFNAVLHMDEQTPHLHIDYIPIARGYERGLEVRNSLDKALKQQGIEGKANAYENSTQNWQNREKNHIETLMRERGWQREPEKGIKREHMTVNQYKAVAEMTENMARQLPEQIEYREPKFGNKESVQVNKKDLEKLSERAKISKVRENSISKLEKSAQQEMARAQNTARFINGVATRKDRESEQIRQEALSLKQKYQNLYNEQKDLNQAYTAVNEELNKERSKTTKLQQKVESLEADNDKMRKTINEMPREVEKAIRGAFQTQMEIDQKEIDKRDNQIKALVKEKEEIARGHGVTISAIRYVLDTLKLGEASRMLLSAIARNGREHLREDGYPEQADRKPELYKHVCENVQGNLEYDGLNVVTKEKGIKLFRIQSFNEAKKLFKNAVIERTRDERGMDRG